MKNIEASAARSGEKYFKKLSENFRFSAENRYQQIYQQNLIVSAR